MESRLKRFWNFVLFGTLLILFSSGCAHVYTAHGAHYRIHKGDTLTKIAKRYKISVQDLAELNNIEDVDEIRPNTSLYLPGVTPSNFAAILQKAGVDLNASDSSNKSEESEAPEEVREIKVAKKEKVEKEKKEPSKDLSVEKEQDKELVIKKPETREPEEVLEPVVEKSNSPIKLERGRFAWPIDGEISSLYGMRHGRKHDGIDIRSPRGTPVRAAADGEVVFSKRMRGYGNLVLVKHPKGFFSVYAHNSVNLVKVGTKVKRGQVVAKVGSTGRATGPHLHFEIREGAKARNPLFFLPKTMYAEKAKSRKGETAYGGPDTETEGENP